MSSPALFRLNITCYYQFHKIKPCDRNAKSHTQLVIQNDSIYRESLPNLTKTISTMALI